MKTYLNSERAIPWEGDLRPHTWRKRAESWHSFIHLSIYSIITDLLTLSSFYKQIHNFNYLIVYKSKSKFFKGMPVIVFPDHGDEKGKHTSPPNSVEIKSKHVKYKK